MTAADDVIERMRALARAQGRDDGPGAPGTADATVLRTALATLVHDDQQLLWEHHVHGRRIGTIARELGLHARAAERRLRAAEQRLSQALSAAHARSSTRRMCIETRSALTDYLAHRIKTHERAALEDHLFSCQGCIRAFIDVREASWTLRDAGPGMLGGLAVAGAGPMLVGAAAAPAAHGGQVAVLGAAGAVLGVSAERLAAGVKLLVAHPAGALAGATAAVVGTALVVGGLYGPGEGLPDPAAGSALSAAPSPSVLDGGPTALPEGEPDDESDLGEADAHDPTDPEQGIDSDDSAASEDGGSQVEAAGADGAPDPVSGGGTAPEASPGESAGPDEPAPAPTSGPGEPTPEPSATSAPTEPTPAPTRGSALLDVGLEAEAPLVGATSVTATVLGDELVAVQVGDCRVEVPTGSGGLLRRVGDIVSGTLQGVGC